VSGRPRPVTARNATAWCFAKARWEMVGKVEEELRAMVLGLHDVIPRTVLGGLALTADDLQMLLTGTGSPLSIHDWRSASLCSALACCVPRVGHASPGTNTAPLRLQVWCGSRTCVPLGRVPQTVWAVRLGCVLSRHCFGRP
jgi:hypothetical protein